MAAVVRRPGLLLLLIVGLMLSLALPSAAEAGPEGPYPGGGRIDLGGGWRFQGESGAGGLARFGWQADRHWMLGIELGFNWYRLRPAQAAGDVNAFKLRVTGTYQILTEGLVLPYVAVGAGYDLVTVSGNDNTAESGAAGYFAGLGVYIPLTGRLGLVIEDRFDIANANVSFAGAPLSIAGGGNLLWMGLVITFPPEAGRVLAP